MAPASDPAGGTLGGHILQAKVRTKDNQDNLAAQEVQRADETFRWAAELSVNKDERKRELA